MLEHNPQVSVVFEYPVAEVTPEIQAGYDWVERIVTQITGSRQGL